MRLVLKKLLSILFAGLLLLQAIPVLHFFAQGKAVFYAYVDEDKPGESKLKVPKEGKEYLSSCFSLPTAEPLRITYDRQVLCLLPAPFHECITPPPDSYC